MGPAEQQNSYLAPAAGRAGVRGRGRWTHVDWTARFLAAVRPVWACRGHSRQTRVRAVVSAPAGEIAPLIRPRQTLADQQQADTAKGTMDVNNLDVESFGTRLSTKPKNFFHGTDEESARQIQAQGFIVGGGLLGRGDCTSTLDKAMEYAKGPHGGIVLELLVDLGNCKQLVKNDPMMTSWQSQYDSAWSPFSANNPNAIGKEENCVKDPKRIKVVRSIGRNMGALHRGGYDIIDGKLIRSRPQEELQRKHKEQLQKQADEKRRHQQMLQDVQEQFQKREEARRQQAKHAQEQFQKQEEARRQEAKHAQVPPACSPALDALEALEQEHAKALQRLEREHGEALARAGVEGDGSEAVERLKREQGRERSTLEQVFRWERHFLREEVRTSWARSEWPGHSGLLKSAVGEA